MKNRALLAVAMLGGLASIGAFQPPPPPAPVSLPTTPAPPPLPKPAPNVRIQPRPGGKKSQNRRIRGKRGRR